MQTAFSKLVCVYLRNKQNLRNERNVGTLWVTYGNLLILLVTQKYVYVWDRPWYFLKKVIEKPLNFVIVLILWGLFWKIWSEIAGKATSRRKKQEYNSCVCRFCWTPPKKFLAKFQGRDQRCISIWHCSNIVQFPIDSSKFISSIFKELPLSVHFWMDCC